MENNNINIINNNLINTNNNIKIKKKEKSTEVSFEVNKFSIDTFKISREDLKPKMIQRIEKKVIRISPEYKKYIKYLREDLDLNTCALLPNINATEENVSLEMHHAPLTLYDITLIVATKLFDDLDKKYPNDEDAEKRKISVFTIADQVMQEHYKNHVGLVPLTKTIHEMIHNNAIIIPLDKINGNYGEFLNIYKNQLTQDMIDKIDLAKSCVNKNIINEINLSKLDKNILKYNILYNNEITADTDKNKIEEE